MPLFLCPAYSTFKMLIDPGSTHKDEYGRTVTTQPKYAKFKDNQFFIDDVPENKDIIGRIRTSPDMTQGMILEAPSIPKPQTSVVQPANDESKAEEDPMQCRYCGQACKTPAGLSAHMRKCKGRIANEPASNNKQDAADSVHKS